MVLNLPIQGPPLSIWITESQVQKPRLVVDCCLFLKKKVLPFFCLRKEINAFQRANEETWFMGGRREGRRGRPQRTHSALCIISITCLHTVKFQWQFHRPLFSRQWKASSSFLVTGPMHWGSQSWENPNLWHPHPGTFPRWALAPPANARPE